MKISQLGAYAFAGALSLTVAFGLAKLFATEPDNTIQITKAQRKDGSIFWLVTQWKDGVQNVKGRLYTDCQDALVNIATPPVPAGLDEEGRPVSEISFWWSEKAGQPGERLKTAKERILNGDDVIKGLREDPCYNGKLIRSNDADDSDEATPLATKSIPSGPFCQKNETLVEQAVRDTVITQLGLSTTHPVLFTEMSQRALALTPRGRREAQIERTKINALVQIFNLDSKKERPDGTAFLYTVTESERASIGARLYLDCSNKQASLIKRSGHVEKLDAKALCFRSQEPDVQEVQSTLADEVRASPRHAVAFLSYDENGARIDYVMSDRSHPASIDFIDCRHNKRTWGASMEGHLLDGIDHNIGDKSLLPLCEDGKASLGTVRAIGTHIMQQRAKTRLTQNGKRLQ